MLKETIAEGLAPLLKIDKESVYAMLESPPQKELGDVAFPCLTRPGVT